MLFNTIFCNSKFHSLELLTPVAQNSIDSILQACTFVTTNGKTQLADG